MFSVREVVLLAGTMCASLSVHGGCARTVPLPVCPGSAQLRVVAWANAHFGDEGRFNPVITIGFTNLGNTDVTVQPQCVLVLFYREWRSDNTLSASQGDGQSPDAPKPRPRVLPDAADGGRQVWPFGDYLSISCKGMVRVHGGALISPGQSAIYMWSKGLNASHIGSRTPDEVIISVSVKINSAYQAFVFHFAPPGVVERPVQEP